MEEEDAARHESQAIARCEVYIRVGSLLFSA